MDCHQYIVSQPKEALSPTLPRLFTSVHNRQYRDTQAWNAISSSLAQDIDKSD